MDHRSTAERDNSARQADEIDARMARLRHSRDAVIAELASLTIEAIVHHISAQLPDVEAVALRWSDAGYLTGAGCRTTDGTLVGYTVAGQWAGPEHGHDLLDHLDRLVEPYCNALNMDNESTWGLAVKHSAEVTGAPIFEDPEFWLPVSAGPQPSPPPPE